ncbi:MAG: VWA protein [Gammaproteobacteria bacterium]|nr:VWA protein [Gammaproteobacteria bacterium]
MSLLAPLFLLGLGLIALPLWLHRLQTQTPEREPFSSTMLLVASEQRVHLHKKLQFLLLLGLRIALLVLLACAFAKPVLEKSTEVFAGESVTLHLLVIDTSFSMGYADHLDAALTTAGNIIDSLDSGQSAQIIAADQRLRIIGERGNDAGQLKSALAALTVGQTRLDFGEMMNGLNGLLEEYNDNIAIHLISDFHASGLPARFADLIPKTASHRPVQLLLYPVSNSVTANWSISSVRRTREGLQVSARGYQSPAQQLTVSLQVNGADVAQQAQLVPANGEMEVFFTQPELASGDNRLVISLAPADNLPGDDRRHVVLENTPALPVLLLTASPDALAVTYLKTALETGGYTVEAVNIADLDTRILPRYPWLVIDDLGAVTAPLAASVTEYLQAGGAVFTALGERSQSLDVLPVSNHPVKSLAPFNPDRFYAIARIDGSHPVLAKAAGWRGVNISRAIIPQTGEEDRVLMSLEGGEPLLLEHEYGAGRLLLLTTGLDNSWSDIPVHSIFVTFMAQTARYLGNEFALERQQHAGDTILLKQAGGASGQVIDPSGQTVLTLADTHSTQNVVLRESGFYEVYTPGRQRLIAVNPDPRESDTAAITPDLLARWRAAGEPLPAGTAGQVVEVAPVTIELWHALLLLLVVIVLAESLLGNRYLGYRTGQ